MGKEENRLPIKPVISILFLIAAGIFADRGANMIGQNFTYGLSLLIFAILCVVVSVGMLRPNYRTPNQTLIENQLASAKKREVYNQRKSILCQSLDELLYDTRIKRPTRTEYETTEYQARIKNCRKLASNTGNPSIVVRTSTILNLIYRYVQQVQQVVNEPDVEFAVETLDAIHLGEINTQLGLLADEVQDE